jgi:hypothetical protein
MISLIEMRDREFVRRCIAAAKSEFERGHKAGTRRTAILALYGGAPSYYISFDHAMRLVNEFSKLSDDERKPQPDDKPSVLRAKHITARVLQLTAEGLSITAAVGKVLMSGHAPQFYISVDYGMRLLNRYTKQSYVYAPVKAIV